MANTPRRPASPMDAAEALFKPVQAKPRPARPAVPVRKEQVTLRLDSDVLLYFQESGPGWQDRINDALRASMTAADPA